MKWIYNIPQKSKIAVLLLVVGGTIMGSNFLEKKFFTDINQSVSSIYNDRLIPAAELFHANDIMYKKRLLLEKFLATPVLQPVGTIQEQLAVYNAQIDSIVLAYEDTYLVNEESIRLQHFKKSVYQYNQLEAKYLAKAGEFSPDVYEKRLAPLFIDIHQDLVQLSSIQTSVGKDLLHGSQNISSGVNLLSNLQMAVAVIIMLVVYTLLLSARSLVPKNLKDFRLN